MDGPLANSLIFPYEKYLIQLPNWHHFCDKVTYVRDCPWCLLLQMFRSTSRYKKAQQFPINLKILYTNCCDKRKEFPDVTSQKWKWNIFLYVSWIFAELTKQLNVTSRQLHPVCKRFVKHNKRKYLNKSRWLKTIWLPSFI